MEGVQIKSRQDTKKSSLLTKRKSVTANKSVSFSNHCKCSDGSVKGVIFNPELLSQNELLNLNNKKEIEIKIPKISKISEFAARMADKNPIGGKKPTTGEGKPAPNPNLKKIQKVKCKFASEGCKAQFAQHGRALENHINNVHRTGGEGTGGKKEAEKSILMTGQFTPMMASTQAMESQTVESQGAETLEEGAEDVGMEIDQQAGVKRKAADQTAGVRRKKMDSESSECLSITASDNISNYGSNYGEQEDTMIEGLCNDLRDAKGEVMKREGWVADLESEVMELRQKLTEAEAQIDQEREEATKTNEELKREIEEYKEQVKEKEREVKNALVSNMRMTGAVPDNEMGNLVNDLRAKYACEMDKHKNTRSDKEKLEEKVKVIEKTIENLMQTATEKSEMITTLKRQEMEKEAMIKSLANKVPCQDFWGRGCMEGENCQYSHTLKYGEEDGVNLRVQPCKNMFLDGFCRWNENCKFDHTMPEDPARKQKFKETLEKMRLADEKRFRGRKRSRSKSPGQRFGGGRTPGSWNNQVTPDSGRRGERTPGNNGGGSESFSGGNRRTPGSNMTPRMNNQAVSFGGMRPGPGLGGITRFGQNEDGSKRRRTEGEVQDAGNAMGGGERVIPPLPEQKSHQSVNNQLRAMQRVAQSPGFQEAERQWTGNYYAQNFPPLNQPPPTMQFQHHQDQQMFGGHYNRYGQQYQEERKREEFNPYLNMQRNDRKWGYGKGGRWNPQQ